MLFFLTSVKILVFQIYHCVKSVCIRSYYGPHFSSILPHSNSELFWSTFFPAFSCIRTEHGEILRIFSPNAGKWGKNADQNNSEYGHFLRSVYQLREHVDDLFITSCQVTSLVYISTWYNHVLKLSTRVGECTSPMWTYVIRNWCIPNGLVTCCIL